jgi:outer membrane protein
MKENIPVKNILKMYESGSNYFKLMILKFFNYLKQKVVLFCVFLVIPNVLVAQSPTDSFPSRMALSDCINFALANQPAVQQSKINEDITRQDIRIALSNWYPQVNANANLQHYLKQPVSFYPDFTDLSAPKRAIASGVANTSTIQFSANQTLYSTDLFFAGKTARDLRKRSSEATQSSKIDVVVNVSKAYYDVLLTEQQLNVLNEDIQRLEQNYKDAFNQYKSGLSDKIDYQRAIIALNNTKSEKKTAEEAVKVKYAYIKQLMGYPSERPLTVLFDSAAMEKETLLDTSQQMSYDNRIEYQLLQTNLKLQKAQIGYYNWSFLPSISAFGNYNIVYQNDQFSQLYKTTYPNSLIGAQLSLPLFQGARRWLNLKKAKLQFKSQELDLTNLKSQMSTEYVQAMASYKSNLNELGSAKENIDIAREIFNTVKLQYAQGVKTYLEVIVSETDLRSAQLNYFNVLFRVLSSTLDVKKAKGNIPVN